MLAHLLLMAQIAAFPGAQGGGAASIGGRGGQVFEVTNANDSGAGSLRNCVQASGPRICVFRIGAQIVNLSRLQVNNPFLTIAGQTAPGGGITIGGANMKNEALFIDTHDVIVQYVTCNGYNPNTPTGPDTGTVCFEATSGTHDVIWDHISARWWGNKGWITYSNDTGACCDKVIKNLTLSNSLFYEPNKTHPVGPGTDAAAWPGEAINQDFVRNLFVNLDHRIPMVATPNIRLVSNVTYNWGYFAVGQGGSSLDAINNRWIAGNLNSGNSNPHPLQAWPGQGGNCTAGPACDLNGTPSIYMLGNTGPQGTDFALTAEECCDDSEGRPETASPIRASWQRSQPLPAEPFPITTEALNEATVGNSQGLNCDGSWFARRDSQDARIVAQYQARGPGNTFTGQFQQPSIAPGTPCPEDPANHLPAAYEAKAGISPGTSASAKAANGYTIFENYLAGTSSGTVTPPPPPATASPDGTTVPPSPAITDSNGVTWALGITNPSDVNGKEIVKNGVADASTAAVLLVWYKGVVYHQNKAGNWWGQIGGSWVKQAGDPRPVTPPASTITVVNVSCLPQTVTFPSPSQCSASVTGTGPFVNNVTWSANAPNGLFTPSNGATSATVTATSAQDATKSGSSTIVVTQPTPPSANPTITFVISVKGGNTTTLTCTWNGGTNAYSCQ